MTVLCCMTGVAKASSSPPSSGFRARVVPPSSKKTSPASSACCDSAVCQRQSLGSRLTRTVSKSTGMVLKSASRGRNGIWIVSVSLSRVSGSTPLRLRLVGVSSCSQKSKHVPSGVSGSTRSRPSTARPQLSCSGVPGKVP
jgi:hypothetical protein